MKEVKTTNQFLRDLKLARKRGKDLRKIETVIDTLTRGHKLAPQLRPLRLQGNMNGLWECHVEPDWRLIWDEAESAISNGTTLIFSNERRAGAIRNARGGKVSPRSRRIVPECESHAV